LNKGETSLDRNVAAKKTLSRRQLLTVLGELEEAVVIADNENRVIFLNHEAAQFFDVKPEQTIGKNISVLTTQEQGLESDRPYIKLLSRGKEADLWVKVKTTPLVDETGKQLGFIHIVRDVTEQENAEDERKYIFALRSEAEIVARKAWMDLNKVAEFIRDPFFLLDLNFKFMYLNRSAENVFRKKATEVIGLSIEDIFPSVKKTQFYQHLSTGKTDTVFTEYFEPLGIWINCSIYRRKEESSEIIGVHFKDTSESIMLERALSESEVKYRQLVNSIQQPFFAMNSHLRVTYWNEEAEKLTKIPAKTALGLHIKEVLSTNKNETIMTYYAVLRDKKPRKLITKIQQDDDERVFEVYIYPSPQGLSVLCKDITESRRLEAELKKYNEKLQQLVEESTKALREAERMAAIGQTAGMVGHDIRNPLQAIISATYLVKDDLSSLTQNETKESLIESMKEIEEQANYINKIVADLQDYARTLNPSAEEIDLRQLIDSILMTTEMNENIQLTSEIANDIQTVHTDQNYLKRILTNLITNAEQAMPNGGKITIKAHKQEENCLITVEDTGEGIPEQNKLNIFKPLFTTKSKGQGFGLAASKRLAKAMNGDITFESEKGKGARFTLTLPYC
jgi:PAS domain S-box-containing protein